MDDFAYFMDWDLEAVVRGCSSNIEAAATTTMENAFLNINFFPEDNMFFSFPEFSESTRVHDELEELYKPFYPVLHTSTLSPHTMVTNPQPIIPKEPDEDVKVKVLKSSQKVAPQDFQQVPAASKSKRSKKNLNKRVVKQVTAADIGVCDAWAWRKYGQKPIKGSPYPRSYYRCSSSKGCLARKQVERNHMDPGVFLVTYTAEHNHPHPTRRNSLAGSTRKNNSILAPTITSSTTTCCNDKNKTTTRSPSASSSNSSSAVSLSPRTPLVVQSMEDLEELQSSNNNNNNNNNNKGLKEEEDFVELLNDADQGFGDDWFPATENIDEIMGLDYQKLEIEIDGCLFMDGFAATN